MTPKFTQKHYKAIADTIQMTDTTRPTPWGRADMQQVVERGVAWVNTPGHGGFLSGRGIAKTYLSEAARKRGMSFGAYLAYEEDCDAAIVLYEHPELFPLLGMGGYDELLASLTYWQESYLRERGIEPDAETLHRKAVQQGRETPLGSIDKVERS